MVGIAGLDGHGKALGEGTVTWAECSFFGGDKMHAK